MGALFRSDVIHRIDDAGRRKLAELGVSRVVDLRSDHEIDAAPNLVDGLGITVHRVPVFDGAAPTAQIPQDITLGALCRNIVDVPDGGSVVVHCTAGKDRTGLVVALGLAAAGLARGDVVSDYALTEGDLRGAWADAMLAGIVAKGIELTPGLIEMVRASPASVMEEVLADLEAAHGTVAGCLRANGLSEAELSAGVHRGGPHPG
ncbi:tyrosine-protein phosphatase [Tessaracoccus flavescens]|uniref:tyrosine-protein phosphatase n=1 Tax=Tessaracoccus flavescens TaxID=399497 RepID=UPI0009868EC9|nr:tyrosine-protein phosphatase [Tessaracoccus flavescens]